MPSFVDGGDKVRSGRRGETDELRKIGILGRSSRTVSRTGRAQNVRVSIVLLLLQAIAFCAARLDWRAVPFCSLVWYSRVIVKNVNRLKETL